MRRFIVTKRERWLQRVEVQAETPLEAVRKAADGDGVIYSDPVYDADIDQKDWNVREEE
jgi:hypothetical protein